MVNQNKLRPEQIARAIAGAMKPARAAGYLDASMVPSAGLSPSGRSDQQDPPARKLALDLATRILCRGARA